MNWQQLNRRQAITAGSAFLAGTAAISRLSAAPAAGSVNPGAKEPLWNSIENILQAQGKFSNGVFGVKIERKDISNVTLHGTPIKPAFQIHGDIYFQKLSGDNVMMNADLAFKPEELDSAIHQFISHGLTFQAEHQHMYDFNPIVWFVHFRQQGNGMQVAHGIKAALSATSTPFPQKMPSNPSTPLPSHQMGQILGAKPEIGADGTVHFNVPRKEQMMLGGMAVNPYLNIATPIAFQPINGGKSAAAIPDFGMIASEVNPVVAKMQMQGWDIGCLYNQETDEHPQLYFSHQFKTGDPIQLANEIRAGLNLMNMKYE